MPQGQSFMADRGKPVRPAWGITTVMESLVQDWGKSVRHKGCPYKIMGAPFGGEQQIEKLDSTL